MFSEVDVFGIVIQNLLLNQTLIDTKDSVLNRECEFSRSISSIESKKV